MSYARPNREATAVTFASPDFPGKVVGRVANPHGDFFDALAALVESSSHLVTEVTVRYADGDPFTLTVEEVTR